MILHGEHIKIYNYGQVIALATSCTIETYADTAETGSSSSSTLKNFTSGRTGWKVTIAKFVESMQSVMIMAGKEYAITMYVNGTDLLSGTAICSEVSTEFSVGKLAQGNCTFIGSGELS